MATSPNLTVRIAANIDALQAALKQAESSIQVTTAGMTRMANSFSGDKIIQQAVNMAAAIDKVGGASKLTEAELARANAVFEKAAAKMTALGSEGADAMRKLAESTRAVKQPIEEADRATQSWSDSFSAVLAGFLSAQVIWSGLTSALNLVVSAIGAVKDALVNAVVSTAALGDQMLTLSNKTGISVESLSEWRYVAGQTGTSVEQITGAIFKLQAELGEGGKKTAQALNAIGLSVEQLRAQRPDEAFETVLEKLRQLPAESDKAAVGVALFGKGFKDMANLTREDIGAMMDRFQELGGTISTELAVSGDAFNDARADWNLLVERINTSIGAAILPAATAFVNIMVESVDRALDQSGMSATEFEAAVSNAFGAVVDVSALVLQAIGVLVQGFAELFTGKWTQEATGLISAIGLVGTNVTNLGQAVALFNGQSGLAGMFERLRAGFVETMRLSTAVAVAGRESERVLVTLGQSMARIGEEMKGRGAEALAAVREQIRQTAESMRNSLGTVNEGLGGVTDSVEEFGRQIDFSDERLQSLVPRIQSFTLPLARLREGGIEAADSFDNLNQTFLEMDPAMRRATVASAETTQRMAQLRTGADHVAESTTEVGLAFDLAGEFVSAFGSELGVLGTILNAAINIVSQYASAVEAAGQAAGNAAKQQAIMNSAATAAATGGMLAAISVGMALKQRYDELEAQAMAVAEEIAGMNEELKEQFGSFTEAQKAAERYGLELEEVNTRFLRISAGMQRRVGYRNDTDEDRLRRFREQLDDLTDRVELAREAAERYGLTWSDMPNVEDRLRAAMTAAKDLEIVFRTLVQSGFDVSAVARGMSDDINAWLNQALRAGIAIPEQMRPMLEALILAGELTEENARLLLGMAESGVPSLNEITAAAERYGITLESLGSKVQQLQIDETAQQLIDDWNILSAATDDMGVVFAGMGEQVQQLVNDAIRYGAELPAAMRPMLQAFIDAGQLVDENGNKLTDLSQLNFAEDLTEQVDRLIEKLDELISAIAGVPPAMGGIGRTATTAASSAADAVEALNEEVTTLPEGWDSTTDAVEMTKQELFDAGRIGAEAAEAIEEASAGARYEVIQVDEAAGDLAETLRNSNYGDPFDAIVDGARSAQEAVEDLEDAVNGVSYGRSPGGLKEWSPMLTQAALTAAVASDRMVSDYDRIARAVNRVTFGSGTFDAGLSTVGTVSPGFGSAGVSGDTTTLNELRAIRRALGNQQPDVIVVPLGPGESWESFEDRLSQRLPRRVIQSSNLRNAWQRAINGGA